MKKTLILVLLTCACILLLVGCDGILDVNGQLGGLVPHEHTLVEHSAKAPTCTEGGWEAYYTCSGCEEYTTYKAIAPLGHDYSGKYLPNGEIHSLFCSRCSETSDEAHNWEAGDIAVTPTCTEAGEQTYVCAGCNAAKAVTVPPLGHDYPDNFTPDGNVHTHSCSRCNKTVIQAHEWSEGKVTKEPTCDEMGVESFACLVCNAVKTQLVDALGHDYKDGYQPSGAVHTRTCSRCDKIAYQAHTWSDGEITKKPTCTEEGIEIFVCSVCNGERTESISSLGHDYTDEYQPDGDVHSRLCTRCSDPDSQPHEWQRTGYTAPTCTESGSEIYVCTVCEFDKTESLSPLGHDYRGDYLTDSDVHSRLCTRCSNPDTQPHDWQRTGYAAPTCTEWGEEIYECLVCKFDKTETLSPLGHDYSDEYQSNGDIHSVFCSRCLVTLDEPHKWQEGEIITAPTCLDAGEQMYVCSVCKTEKAEALKALGHDYSEIPQQNGDVHSYVCSRCPAQIDETHEWVKNDLSTEPNCTNSGTDVYKCTECDAQKTEILPALGHDFSGEYQPNGDVHSITCSHCTATLDEDHQWQTVEYIAPDCANMGYRKYVCSVCNLERYEDLPTTDEHVEGEWEIAIGAAALTDGLKVLHCSVCGIKLDEQILYRDVNSMPIIYLEGDYLSATAAKNEVEMSFSYVDPNGDDSFDGYATIKVQGATSVSYAKKNYTIKFYKDDTYDKKLKVDLGWGKESKYVMKANWVDFIQARNVVSCRLWGDMVLTRNETEIQKRLAALPTNGGAIDGYPIAVFMNGNFHGIYTMNVPKDEWMFGMDDSETEALLGADDWNHTNFSSYIGYFEEDAAGDLVTDGWELKYCGSDDVTWVTDSFNALIQFCWDNEGEAFKAGISNHLDVDAAIDYLIYMYVNYMRDNASKNILWATYDGKIWIPSVYDQDGVFGQVWDGKRYAGASESLPKINSDGSIGVGVNFGPSSEHTYEGKNFILWDRIWNAYTEEILIRYKELRETTLNEENIIAEFEAFRACIPESVYEADIERWEADRNAWWGSTSGVWYEKFNYEYTYEWIRDRLNYFDDAMSKIYNNVYLPSVDTPAL